MENIINIVNFIRGAEPRDRSMDLVEPVREQIRLMKEYNLPGTFLVQYDAMIREDILELLLPLDPEQFEIGIWLEMNEPHTIAAGLPWRGREGFEWDWHANVGFSVGYTPKEREKLVDAIFEKFESVFGRKAKSVGAWMIDAYTLDYMARRYDIVASCNCKDQWGTDGYTIWGGYWNQAYYPSKRNVLCPAQSDELSIPVPVFRMLGSDPVTQYDLGLKVDDSAVEWQHVATLEPVYDNVGGDSKWVDWFMRQNYRGGSLAFAYAQAGQENSFGWAAMKVGLEYQFPLFAKWRETDGLRVERLEDSGRWFKAQFAQTPATAISALEPYGERQAQSVWYNCKNYRVNIYKDAEGIRIRDWMLFDEKWDELYLDSVCETEYLVYENLPVMDGNRMSGGGVRAGGWLTNENGDIVKPDEISVEEKGSGLVVRFDGGALTVNEDGVILKGVGVHMMWNHSKTAYVKADGNCLEYDHRGRRYALRVVEGKIEEDRDPRLKPVNGQLVLKSECRE